MKLPTFKFKRSNKNKNPVPTDQKNMRIIKMLLAIVLALLLLTLFMVMQLQSNATHRFQQEGKQVHSLQQNEKHILSTLLQQQKTTHTALLAISTTLSTVTAGQKQQQHDFVQYQEQAKQQLAQVTQSVTQAVKAIQSLTDQVQTQPASSAKMAAKHPPQATSKYNPAPDYHLYGVEPYGVVIVDSKGKFIIARVGRNIPGLGEVKAITADQVIAGDYVITRQ